MGKLRLVAVSLLAFTACGDDSGGTTPQDGAIVDAAPIDMRMIDAPPEVTYDYSCPTSPPTDIATTVTVSGVAQQLNGTSQEAAMGVVITAYRINTTGPDQLLDTTAGTPSNGAFTTALIATNGTALNGYLKGTKASYWPTYLYPASPLAQSLAGVPVIMINDANVELAETLGQTDQLPGNGIIGVALTDCASPTPAQIPNATIEVYSGSTRVGDDALDVGAILGPNFPDVQGLYLIPNVPPGPVTVKATYYSHTFLENDVTSYADSLTTAQIKPGY